MPDEDIRVTFQKYVAEQRLQPPEPPRDGWLKRIMTRCLNRITRGEYKLVRDQWADY
jgi:hypothetical protein